MFKRLFFSLLLAQMSLFAINPLSISKNDLITVEKKYGPSALLRITDYHHKYEKWERLSSQEKLIRVNYYINGMLGQYDAYTYDNKDYWATPKEFLFIGKGDCEDYVSLKFFTLLALGIKQNELYYAVVKDVYSNRMHMVLLHKVNNKLFVLDNLSSRVLELHERVDLKFSYAFNEKAIYVMSKTGQLLKTKNKEKRFTKLLEKIKKGH